MENVRRVRVVWAAGLPLLMLGSLTAAEDGANLSHGGDAEVLLGGGTALAEALGWRRELPLCGPATSWNSSQLASANWSSAYCFPTPEMTSIL